MAESLWGIWPLVSERRWRYRGHCYSKIFICQKTIHGGTLCNIWLWKNLNLPEKLIASNVESIR
jgi:hypothetical protein